MKIKFLFANLIIALILFSLIKCTKQENQNNRRVGFSAIAEIGIKGAKTKEEGPYQFSYIRSIDCDAAGNIYVFDHMDVCVKVFDQNGNFLRKMFGAGKGPNELNNPYRIFINNFSNHLFVLQEHGYQLKEFDISGNFVKLYNLPEQFIHYADFIDKDRLLFISKGIYGEDTYSNFKILNLVTLKIYEEWAESKRDSIINAYQRFAIKDGVLWTCPGDKMELAGYDIESGKEISALPIKEEYKQFEIIKGQREGRNFVTVRIYNFAQPLLIRNKIHVLVTKQDFLPQTGRWLTHPKYRNIKLYRLLGDQLIKVADLPKLNFFIDFHTIWRNRIIIASSGYDEYPRIVILELSEV